jgi:hypothetical protein
LRAPTVYSRISFKHPFALRGVAAMQPAGSYSIETSDRHYWTSPFSWETRTKTKIRICTKAGLEGRLHEIVLNPRDLFAALQRDRLLVSV